MTTIKQASRHRQREMALFLGVSLSGSALVFSMSYFIDSMWLLMLFGLVVCVAILAILVKVSGKWDKAFRCPDCGGPVDDSLDTEGKASAPILRLCPACDVLWQTGVTVAD